MRSQALQVKLAELNISPSHSRPRVSNDNAYVESLFRMLKYVPQWPSSGFKTREEARVWVDKFTGCYNEEHRYSGIGYVTPLQRYTVRTRCCYPNEIRSIKRREQPIQNVGQGRCETGNGRVASRLTQSGKSRSHKTTRG